MSAGFTSVSSSLFLTGLFGIVKVLSTTSFMFVFVRLRGNRFWLQFGSAVCGVSMLVLAYCASTWKTQTQSRPAYGGCNNTCSYGLHICFCFWCLPWTALLEYLQRDLPRPYKSKVLCDYNLCSAAVPNCHRGDYATPASEHRMDHIPSVRGPLRR